LIKKVGKIDPKSFNQLVFDKQQQNIDFKSLVRAQDFPRCCPTPIALWKRGDKGELLLVTHQIFESALKLISDFSCKESKMVISKSYSTYAINNFDTPSCGFQLFAILS
jgi:hypothetical protein